MKFRSIFAALPVVVVPVVLVVVALSPTRADAADRPRPNVLFIAIDDLRNDLGAMGVTHARTPHAHSAATHQSCRQS